MPQLLNRYIMSKKGKKRKKPKREPAKSMAELAAQKSAMQKKDTQQQLATAAARRAAFEAGLQDSSSTWEALPGDLLLAIARHSDSHTMVSCRLVCKRWNFFFTASTQELKPKSADTLAALTAEFPDVRNFNLTACEGLRNVHLKKLVETKTCFFKMLVGQGLATNTLTGTYQVSNEGLESLALAKSITCLGLSWLPGITAGGLRHICEHMPQLNALHIIGCGRLNAGAFKSLNCLTNLKSLTIQRCPKVQFGVVTELETLSSLKRLNLGGTRTYVPNANHVWPLTQLVALELSNVITPATGGVNIGVHFKHLTSLGLCVDSTTHRDWKLSYASIWTKDRLRHANLRYSVHNVPCFNIKYDLYVLLGCTKLQTLKVDLSMDCQEQHIRDLAGLKKLKALTLGCQVVNNAALKGVSALTMLQTAEFVNTHIPLTLLEAVMALQLENLALMGPCQDGTTISQESPALTFTSMPMLAFAEMRTIQRLDLSHTTLQYEQAVDVITKIANCQKACKADQDAIAFEELILHGCPIDVSGQQHLREMFPAVHINVQGRVQFDGSSQPWEDHI